MMGGKQRVRMEEEEKAAPMARATAAMTSPKNSFAMRVIRQCRYARSAGQQMGIAAFVRGTSARSARMSSCSAASAMSPSKLATEDMRCTEAPRAST